MPIRLHVAPDREATGTVAASILQGLLHRRPAATIGLATGSSPLPLYEALVREHADLSRARFAALDEYVGLAADDPNSYRRFLIDRLLAPLGLDPTRLNIPDGGCGNAEEAARAYEARLAAAGPVALQILGIGSNGHLGFNEPPAQLASRCHVVRLAERTRQDNARFFASPEAVPTHAITQGLGNISEAGTLLLMAWGEAKAVPVARALEGPVTISFPASMLQLHSDAIVVVDRLAASRLTESVRDLMCAS